MCKVYRLMTVAVFGDSYSDSLATQTLLSNNLLLYDYNTNLLLFENYNITAALTEITYQ